MTEIDIDLVVVGLGTMGSMALYQAARMTQGRVVGIEQYRTLHTQGSFTGESRLFRVAAKEGRLYTPALLEARRQWLAVGAEYGRDLLLPAGTLSVGPRGLEVLETTLAAMTDHDLPHEVLDAADLRRRYPQLHVEDDDLGLLDPLGGGLRPELAVHAATTLARAHGAEVRSETAVLGVHPAGDHVVVETSGGPVRARRAILTPGAWTSRVVPELADLVRVASYALTWFVPRTPELFTPDRFPGFLRDLGPVHAFGVPTLDGWSMKVCPDIPLGEVTDVEDRVTTLTREQVRTVGEQAVALIPDLEPEPVRWSVHPDAVTASHVPIIDTLHDGLVTVATGMSGNGFKFAPVWGLAAAQLALTGSSPWQHERFRAQDHRARLAASA